MYSNILFERKAGIAVITLNRPRVLNALSRALKAELSDALGRVAKDRGGRRHGVRVLRRGDEATLEQAPPQAGCPLFQPLQQ